MVLICSLFLAVISNNSSSKHRAPSRYQLQNLTSSGFVTDISLANRSAPLWSCDHIFLCNTLARAIKVILIQQSGCCSLLVVLKCVFYASVNLFLLLSLIHRKRKLEKKKKKDMSIQEPDQNCVSSGNRGDFFIPSDTERNWAEDGERVGAEQKRLRRQLDALFRAVRCETESVRPEHISTLTEIIMRNFRKKETSVSWTQSAHEGEVDGELDCPGCNRFIAEPVTVTCGHSYCRSCLQQSFLPKCKKCREEFGAKHLLCVNVLLCGLLEKWFPEEIQKTKRIAEVKGLLRSRRFSQAVSLATKLLQSGKFKNKKFHLHSKCSATTFIFFFICNQNLTQYFTCSVFYTDQHSD